MLVIYDKRDGTVIDNTGTCSAWPYGPPDPADVVDPPEPQRDEETDQEWAAIVAAWESACAAARAERDERQAVLDRVVMANAGDVPAEHVGYVRVDDDSDLAQQLLTHEHSIDLETGEVIVGAPIPAPEPGPSPRDLALAAVEAAQNAATDSEKIDHLTTALSHLLGGF